MIKNSVEKSVENLRIFNHNITRVKKELKKKERFSVGYIEIIARELDNLTLCRQAEIDFIKIYRRKNLVKRVRKRNNLSVKALAMILGRSHRTIENWEQGRTIPPAAIRTLKIMLKK